MSLEDAGRIIDTDLRTLRADRTTHAGQIDSINTRLGAVDGELASLGSAVAALQTAVEALQPPHGTNTPPATTPDHIGAFISAVRDGGTNPDIWTLMSAEDGADLYDLARNVGPTLLSICILHHATGDDRLLELGRDILAAAENGCTIGRYRAGIREWRDGPNRNMDGLMWHAPLAAFIKRLAPADPARVMWLDYLNNDYLRAHGERLPFHALAHPQLATAVLAHELGMSSTRDAALARWENRAREVSGMIVYPHNINLPDYDGAQRTHYGRYVALYLHYLWALDLVPMSDLEGLAAAVTHYVLDDIPSGSMAPTMIGNNNPDTGLRTTYTERRSLSNWGNYAGFALLAPHDPTGTMDALNQAHSGGGVAHLAGIALTEAA